MKNVGILAAMTISVLGPASDVACFFKLIVCFLEGGRRGSKYPAVTERLYLRSIERGELERVKLDLESVRCELYKIPMDIASLEALGLNIESTRLDLNGQTLGEVFARFFEGFFDAIECTYVFYSEFDEYIPLRIGFSDMPDYIVDISRSCDMYESLSPDALPFWLIDG